MHRGILPYRKPELGKDYWVQDNILSDPLSVTERCFNKSTWIMGAPWRPEPWPGMRAPDALLPSELSVVEQCVIRHTGVRGLRAQADPSGASSGHNFVQLVGGGEAVARPHVDSSKLCDYAAVLYLHPCPPTKHAGTSFYRLRLPDGTLDGNTCPTQYESLSQIPGFQEMDLSMWEEELEVPYVYNRLLFYKSDLVHSATAYFGWSHELMSKRIAAVFFWKVA